MSRGHNAALLFRNRYRVPSARLPGWDYQTSGYQAFAWQERFHDRILDSLEDLERARAYIRQNPQRWQAKRKEP